MKNKFVQLAIWVLVIGGAFAFFWYKGYLQRLSDYVTSTKEELRKCAWPSRDELKGSTVVVMISIALMGLFTVAVDLTVSQFVHFLIKLNL